MSELIHHSKAFIAYFLLVFSPASLSVDNKTYLIFSVLTSRRISLLTTHDAVTEHD
jgi:hypothetical protein